MAARLLSGYMALLMGLMVWSCSGAPSPGRGVWVAEPEFAEVDHPRCTVRIEPQKMDAPFFASFILTLTNKSGDDLEIDWNESRYLFNGSPQGVLVFEGIDPEAVRQGSVAPQIVPPGDRFSRQLMPLRLIAWTPLSEKTARRRGIAPGMLPSGENGIHLVVRQANERLTFPLAVRISHNASP